MDFRTKPEFARDLLGHVLQQGYLPGRWVAADEVYGNSPDFRDGVTALGLWYVADIEVAEGAQGPRIYRFARRRVWESRDGLPGRECWLLVRTNRDGEELRYALSNAPADVPLLHLAQVQTARWRIETDFETLKG